MISCKESKSNSKSNESTKTNIVELIKTKTDLELSENFEIIKDTVEHTEEAFDSDYSYELTIEYKESDSKNIKEQILNSKFFDTINSTNYADPIWEIIDSKTNKGIWTYDKNGFEFLHCDNKKNRPEPFYLTVDTITKRIELILIHL